MAKAKKNTLVSTAQTYDDFSREHTPSDDNLRYLNDTKRDFVESEEEGSGLSSFYKTDSYGGQNEVARFTIVNTTDQQSNYAEAADEADDPEDYADYESSAQEISTRFTIGNVMAAPGSNLTDMRNATSQPSTQIETRASVNQTFVNQTNVDPNVVQTPVGQIIYDKVTDATASAAHPSANQTGSVVETRTNPNQPSVNQTVSVNSADVQSNTQPMVANQTSDVNSENVHMNTGTTNIPTNVSSAQNIADASHASDSKSEIGNLLTNQVSNYTSTQNKTDASETKDEIGSVLNETMTNQVDKASAVESLPMNITFTQNTIERSTADSDTSIEVKKLVVNASKNASPDNFKYLETGIATFLSNNSPLSNAHVKSQIKKTKTKSKSADVSASLEKDKKEIENVAKTTLALNSVKNKNVSNYISDKLNDKVSFIASKAIKENEAVMNDLMIDNSAKTKTVGSKKSSKSIPSNKRDLGKQKEKTMTKHENKPKKNKHHEQHGKNIRGKIIDLSNQKISGTSAIKLLSASLHSKPIANELKAKSDIKKAKKVKKAEKAEKRNKLKRKIKKEGISLSSEHGKQTVKSRAPKPRIELAEKRGIHVKVSSHITVNKNGTKLSEIGSPSAVKHPVKKDIIQHANEGNEHKDKPKAKTTTKAEIATKTKTTTKAAVKSKVVTNTDTTTKTKVATKVEISTKPKTATKTKIAAKAEITTKAETASKVKTSTKTEVATKPKTATKTKEKESKDAKKKAKVEKKATKKDTVHETIKKSEITHKKKTAEKVEKTKKHMIVSKKEKEDGKEKKIAHGAATKKSHLKKSKKNGLRSKRQVGTSGKKNRVIVIKPRKGLANKDRHGKKKDAVSKHNKEKHSLHDGESLNHDEGKIHVHKRSNVETEQLKHHKNDHVSAKSKRHAKTKYDDEVHLNRHKRQTVKDQHKHSKAAGHHKHKKSAAENHTHKGKEGKAGNVEKREVKDAMKHHHSIDKSSPTKKRRSLWEHEKEPKSNQRHHITAARSISHEEMDRREKKEVTGKKRRSVSKVIAIKFSKKEKRDIHSSIVRIHNKNKRNSVGSKKHSKRDAKKIRRGIEDTVEEAVENQTKKKEFPAAEVKKVEKRSQVFLSSVNDEDEGKQEMEKKEIYSNGNGNIEEANIHKKQEEDQLKRLLGMI